MNGYGGFTVPSDAAMRSTAEEIMTEFLSNQLSIHTRVAYRSDIKSFFDAFSMEDLGSLTPEDIAEYRDRLLERLKPSTVARNIIYPENWTKIEGRKTSKNVLKI